MGYVIATNVLAAHLTKKPDPDFRLYHGPHEKALCQRLMWAEKNPTGMCTDWAEDPRENLKKRVEQTSKMIEARKKTRRDRKEKAQFFKRDKNYCIKHLTTEAQNQWKGSPTVAEGRTRFGANEDFYIGDVTQLRGDYVGAEPRSLAKGKLVYHIETGAGGHVRKSYNNIRSPKQMISVDWKGMPPQESMWSTSRTLDSMPDEVEYEELCAHWIVNDFSTNVSVQNKKRKGGKFERGKIVRPNLGSKKVHVRWINGHRVGPIQENKSKSSLCIPLPEQVEMDQSITQPKSILKHQ